MKHKVLFLICILNIISLPFCKHNVLAMDMNNFDFSMDMIMDQGNMSMENGYDAINDSENTNFMNHENDNTLSFFFDNNMLSEIPMEIIENDLIVSAFDNGEWSSDFNEQFDSTSMIIPELEFIDEDNLNNFNENLDIDDSSFEQVNDNVMSEDNNLDLSNEDSSTMVPDTDLSSKDIIEEFDSSIPSDIIDNSNNDDFTMDFPSDLEDNNLDFEDNSNNDSNNDYNSEDDD